MESFSVGEVGRRGRANEPASFFPPEWKWKSGPVDRDTAPCQLYFHLEFSMFYRLPKTPRTFLPTRTSSIAAATLSTRASRLFDYSRILDSIDQTIAIRILISLLG